MSSKMFPLIIATLIIASITALPAIAYAQSTPVSSLRSMGIAVPQQSILPHVAAVYHISFGNLKLVKAGKWVLPVVKGASRYMVHTGYPSLPFKVVSVVINGYASKVHVYVSVSSYKVIKVSRPVIPGPTPIRYGPMLFKPRNLSLTRPRIVVNATVYSSNKFFPGSVVRYLVLHGLHGKTVVLIYVTPVQYNPAKHELVFIKSLSIVVSYGSVEKIRYNPKGLLIITNSTLAPYVEKYLVPIYKKLGYQVTLVTTEYIWKHYKPAPPIMRYPGFYMFMQANPFMIPFWIMKYYNYTLALKIIEYLRKTLGNYSYVLIVGGARTVPPSFYYFSALEYFEVSFRDAWIPTDYFYASPDYDLLPNMFVGRIPLDNPKYIELYAHKLEVWYQTLPKRKPLIALGGGYIFGLTYAFAESYLETLVDEGLGKAPIVLFTQTSGAYNPTTVAEILSGKVGAMISVLMAHGDGYGLYEPTLWGVGITGWETLAYSYELLTFKPTTMYQVVMTVACEDGWWDYNIVPLWPLPVPPFKPGLPFWKALLISPAGAVAFIDAARVNWDYLWIEMFNGTLVTQSYGASALLGDMLLTYASLIGHAKNVTLGTIYWLGMTEFLKTIYPFMGSFALQEMMLYQLIGDPTLVLKLPTMPVAQSRIVKVKPVNEAVMLDFTSPLWGLPFTAPIYLATKTGEVAINASAGCYKVEIYREWTYGVFDSYLSMALLWVQKVGETKFCLNKSGVYVLKLKFSPMVSGYLMLRIVGKNYFYRFYLGALGARALTTTTTKGERVTIQAYGLDLFGLSSKVGIDVGNRIVNTMYVPFSGFITYTITLPYTGTGTHIVGVKLITPGVGFLAPGAPELWAYGWPGIPGIQNIRILDSLLQTPVKVYGVYPLSIGISVPSSVELNSTVAITIMTTVNGKPVSAKLTAYIVTPSGKKVPLKLVEKAPGIYVASYTPKALGIYTIVVNGSAASSKLYAYASGYAAKSFVAIERLYNMASYVAGTVTKEVSSAKKALSTEISSVATKLSAQISSSTSTITSAVMEAAKSLNTSVVKAIGRSTNAVLSSISSAKTALSTQISGVEKSLSSKISAAVSSITSAISSSTTALKSYMSTEFSSVNAKLGSISSGISSINAKLSTVSTTLAKISSGVSSIQTTLGKVTSTLSTINSKLSSISSEIASAQKALSTQISSVEKTLSTELSSGISKIQSSIASAKSALSSQISSATTELSHKIASVQASIKPLAIAATALSAICIGLIAATLGIVARRK